MIRNLEIKISNHQNSMEKIFNIKNNENTPYFEMDLNQFETNLKMNQSVLKKYLD